MRRAPQPRQPKRTATAGGSDWLTVCQLSPASALAHKPPLVLADGAVHVDTTDLTLDEVIETIVGMVTSVEVGP